MASGAAASPLSSSSSSSTSNSTCSSSTLCTQCVRQQQQEPVVSNCGGGGVESVQPKCQVLQATLLSELHFMKFCPLCLVFNVRCRVGMHPKA
jgi:hypothetical protein